IQCALRFLNLLARHAAARVERNPQADRDPLRAEVRDFHRLIVFVDEKVVSPKTWHESSARIGYGRGHVDQLDAAPETKALLVARPYGRLLRLLSMRRHHNRGDDHGDDQRAGHTETFSIPTSITTIDVRDDAIFSTEADAVAAD